MIAMTTSNSMSVKARRRAGDMMSTTGFSFLPRRAKAVPWPKAAGGRGVRTNPVPLGGLRPKHRTRLDGQVFWLTARDDTQAAFPRYNAVASWPGALADHSGGPATDSHRLPSLSQRLRAGN